jgi:hypothetical protein
MPVNSAANQVFTPAIREAYFQLLNFDPAAADCMRS